MNLKIRTLLLICFLVVGYCSFSQQFVTMENRYGATDRELQNVLNFENIFLERLSFKGPDLIGKKYKVTMKEFKDGQLSNATVLFDGTDGDFFKVTSDSVNVGFLFKLENEVLKTQVFGQRFGSRKLYLPLVSKADDYALKDFFGRKKKLTLNIDSVNAVFAIITPTIHEDGSGSYCEVAQSPVPVEQLGTYFKIPHYFIVYISFE